MKRKKYFNNFTDFFKRYKRNKLALIGLILLIYLVFNAVFSSQLTSRTPFELAGSPFSPPSPNFIMGSDDLGRDIYSQILYGSRISLLIGFSAAITSTIFGGIIGSIAGYFGGFIDDVLMRIAEIFQVIPRLFLGIIFVSIFGANFINIIVILSVLSWPSSARLIRSMFISIKEQEFVDAARSMGASNFRLIFIEILPNAISPLIVTMSLAIGSAITTEAGLSFLGLGDPNYMTWGYMLFNAQKFIRRAWWVTFFPGLYLMLTVLSFNLIGDGLDEALNPRLRERR